MKRKWMIPMVLVLALFLAGCSPASGEKKADSSDGTVYHKITAKEGKKMMDDGEVTIVDVRTPEEFEAEHIPDAVNVPNETIGSEIPEVLPDKDAVLIVYCRTGVRSKESSDKLAELGYQNIYDIGGIVDWPYQTKSDKFSS